MKEIYRKKLVKLSGLTERVHLKLYNKNRKAYNSVFLNALAVYTKLEKVFHKKSSRCALEFRRQFEKLSGKALSAENLIKLYSAKLQEQSPSKILAKGYARIYKNDKAVKFSQDLQNGDNIKILMSDGRISAVVDAEKNIE